MGWSQFCAKLYSKSLEENDRMLTAMIFLGGFFFFFYIFSCKHSITIFSLLHVHLLRGQGVQALLPFRKHFLQDTFPTAPINLGFSLL